ncbi:MAG TPA: c-type cytochrome [Bryobacteraceae bacterium]|nr:c-type cytochrome [Bryobacteraceae bacterium]
MLTVLLPLAFFMQFMEMPSTNTNPYTSDADLVVGKKLYLGRCAGCHGPTGDGGKGANLAVPRLTRATTDLALWRTIRYGIRDTEMPSHNLSTKEVWQVVTFVKSLGRVDKSAVPGDPARGKQVAQKAGCFGCHNVNTEGGGFGPALNDVGVRRSPGYLRAKLSDASRDIDENFRIVQATTKGGQTINGIRLNEDTWSLQVRDYKNNFHSFWKSDLTNVKLERRTPMPSYAGRLSNSELDDVVAYLMTLRGGSE